MITKKKFPQTKYPLQRKMSAKIKERETCCLDYSKPLNAWTKDGAHCSPWCFPQPLLTPGRDRSCLLCKKIKQATSASLCLCYWIFLPKSTGCFLGLCTNGDGQMHPPVCPCNVCHWTMFAAL